MVSGQTLDLVLTGDPTTEWGIVLVGDGQGTAIEGSGGAITWTPTFTGTGTIGVVNLAPIGFDADDPLEAASFELNALVRPETEADPIPEPKESSGCGCQTSGSPGFAGGVLTFLLLRRRCR